METKLVSKVRESHRAVIRCKYISSGRIAVSRWDSPIVGKDPNKIIVNWDYCLEIGENYVLAVEKYLEKANWGGVYHTATTPEGAVAVWVGEVTP